MRHFRILASAALLLTLLPATPAKAQATPQAVPQLPKNITYPEFQGLGCLVGGTIVAISAATYAQAVTVGAATQLAVPIMAASFVAGCGVGSIMTPGLWWIYRQLQNG